MKTITIILEDENEVFEDTENHEIESSIRKVIDEYLEDFYVVEVQIDNDNEYGPSPYNKVTRKDY